MNRSSPGAQGSIRVLIVDDSEVIRSLLRRTLTLYSYQITEAADGMDALALLSQDSAFALLIVDLAMPRMDGIALIQRLRSDSSLPRFSILVLTGEEIDPAAPPPAGADALMIKPFKPSELLQVVRALTTSGSGPALPAISSP